MKKGERITKIFFTIFTTISIITTIFLIIITTAIAQEGEPYYDICIHPSVGCVLNIAGKDTGYTECMTLEGHEKKSGEISDFPECTMGCCCSTSSDEVYTDYANITCQNIEGIFKEYSGTIENRQEYCTNICSSNTIQISGTITYNDESTPVPGAILKYKNPTTQTIEKQKTTNTNGQYSVFLEQSKQYALEITKPGRTDCTKTDTIGGSVEDTEINYTLDCEITPPECQKEWSVSEWSNEEGKCGTRTVTLITECETDNSPSPISELACFTEGDVCDNTDGEILPGEECDQGNFNGKTCQTLGFDSGELICSNSCQIVTTNCVYCPATPEECGQKSSYCDSCDICQDSPICTTTNEQCQITSLNPSLTYTYDPNLKANLDWTPSPELTEGCEVIHYKIERCKTNTEGNCGEEEPSTLTYTTENTYTDEEIEPLTNREEQAHYCYNITATIQTPFVLETTEYTETICKQIPHAICLEKETGDFCTTETGGGTSQIIGTCSEEHIYSENSCTPGEFCLESIDEKAKCSNVTICDYCNGPYALFGYSELPITSRIDFGEIDICSDDELEMCYLDSYSKTQTTIGNYKACTDVKTCYDYKTRTSCEQNACKLDKLQEKCEWINLTENNELGIGICSPTNPEELDCTKCETDNPFGENACTKQICQKYGDCFYNEKTSNYITDKNTCINQKNVTCYTYDTENQCTGNTPFKADIIYDEENELVGNTHKIMQTSQSLYDHNTKCYWYNNEANPENSQCLKDADMTRNLTEGVSEQKISDCSRQDTKCQKDEEEPTTQLIMKDQTENCEQQTQTTDYPTIQINSNSHRLCQDEISAQKYCEEQGYQQAQTTEINGGGSNGAKWNNNEWQTANCGFISITCAGTCNNEYSKTELKQLIPQRKDNKYTGDDLETYYSITQNNESYPNKEWKSNNYAGDIEVLDANQNYVLSYFTKDKANNYEEIKQKEFKLIADMLNYMQITHQVTSAYIEGIDSFRSNLTTTLTSPRPVICKTTLTKQPNSEIQQGADTQQGTQITNEYQHLEDGEYVLAVKCKDEHQQTYETNYLITIDADTTIKDVTPRGKYTPQKLNISITTTANATCYYREVELNNPDYQPIKPANQEEAQQILQEEFIEKGTKFEETGNKTHRTEKEYNEQKFNLYYTACKFQNETVFIGNYGDTIYAAIDKTPPRLTINDTETQTEYNSTEPKQEVTLLFDCNDNTEALKIGEDTYYDFGCKEITYCLYNDPSVGCQNKNNINNIINNDNLWTKKFTLEETETEPGEKLYMNLTIYDNGNNTKIKDGIRINIRNLNFDPPDIDICEDDLTNCISP